MESLLTAARTQAERSSQDVRAVARMRIAHVESASDRSKARVTLEMAVEDVHPLPVQDRAALFKQARQVAAAFAPDLVRELPTISRVPASQESEELLSTMLQHGLTDAALDYVLGEFPSGFPFGYTGNLMQMLDETRRISVLRRAIRAWRAPDEVEAMRQHPVPHAGGYDNVVIYRGQLQVRFMHLFQHHWHILPPDEALSIAREFVQSTLDQPDLGTSAGYPDGVHFTSSREHSLFEVFHVLRRLDPAWAESLVADHEQLSAATQRFPDSVETISSEAEVQAEERRKAMAASGETCTGGVIMTGGRRELSLRIALHESARAGDFGPSIEHALDLYREDIDPESPNQALKPFWPSTSTVRTTFYTAGKRLGGDAVKLLNRLSDPDLLLFAQISLAAALADLPALPEFSMKQPRRAGLVP